MPHAFQAGWVVTEILQAFDHGRHFGPGHFSVIAIRTLEIRWEIGPSILSVAVYGSCRHECVLSAPSVEERGMPRVIQGIDDLTIRARLDTLQRRSASGRNRGLPPHLRACRAGRRVHHDDRFGGGLCHRRYISLVRRQGRTLRDHSRGTAGSSRDVHRLADRAVPRRSHEGARRN